MEKTFNQVAVEIRRNKSEHVHVDVPAHEVQVLRRVHGASHVTVVGKSRKTVTLDPSAEAEFARLRRKYRVVNGPDPVLGAFVTGPEDLLEFGFTSDPAYAADEGSSVIDHEELRRQAAEAEAARGASTDSKHESVSPPSASEQPAAEGEDASPEEAPPATTRRGRAAASK